MIINPIKTRLFNEGDDLLPFICSHVKEVQERDVIVITSKIVALAQKRVIKKSEKELTIRQLSTQTIPNRWGFLTLLGGEWCMNAGADESNGFGKVILLPHKEFMVAHELCETLKRKFDLKNFGVIISDTRSIPLRRGVEGIAFSHAGFKPVKSYIGKPDLAGRKMGHTEINVADALAAVAVFAMGEGNERQPLCVIQDSGVCFTGEVYNARSVQLDPSTDIYRSAYTNTDEAT
jgi:F420-0:gamma-glutamyl ligase